MIKGKNILITGGSGFIGTNLAKALVNHNEITTFDNQTRNALKYTTLERHDNFKFVKGDVLDRKALEKNVKEKDIVIHLAAIAGISSYEKHPLKTMEVNLLGSYNMLSASLDEELELFINFSTSEVYGPHAQNVNEASMTQQGPVGQNRWTYSVSKLAAEHFGFAFWHEKKLPFASVRPFNIYGPGQVGEGAIEQFVTRAIINHDLKIYGDGNQIRSWCYIQDMIDAIMLMLENRRCVGKTFIIGNPQATLTIKELAEKVVQVTGSKSRIVFDRKLNADVIERIPDIGNAKKILGFKPKVSLNDGLKKTVDWYREISHDTAKLS